MSKKKILFELQATAVLEPDSPQIIVELPVSDVVGIAVGGVILSLGKY